MNAIQSLALDKLVLRAPSAADGHALHQLVSGDVGLDQNSLMCNLLQCSHFADTSVAAYQGDQLVGFVSAYKHPNRPRSLFVWQLVVAEHLRGQGLGKHMLRWLLAQPICEDIYELTAAITPTNAATWKLFDSFARECGALPVKSMLFSREAHFKDAQEDQYLLSISPLPNRAPLKSMARHLDEMRATSTSMRLPGSRRLLD